MLFRSQSESTANVENRGACSPAARSQSNDGILELGVRVAQDSASCAGGEDRIHCETENVNNRPSNSSAIATRRIAWGPLPSTPEPAINSGSTSPRGESYQSETEVETNAIRVIRKPMSERTRIRCHSWTSKLDADTDASVTGATVGGQNHSAVNALESEKEDERPTSRYSAHSSEISFN